MTLWNTDTMCMKLAITVFLDNVFPWQVHDFWLFFFCMSLPSNSLRFPGFPNNWSSCNNATNYFFFSSMVKVVFRPTFVVSSAWRNEECCLCRIIEVDPGTSYLRAVWLTGPRSRPASFQSKDLASGLAWYSAWCIPPPVRALPLREDSSVQSKERNDYIYPVLGHSYFRKVDVGHRCACLHSSIVVLLF